MRPRARSPTCPAAGHRALGMLTVLQMPSAMHSISFSFFACTCKDARANLRRTGPALPARARPAAAASRLVYRMQLRGARRGPAAEASAAWCAGSCPAGRPALPSAGRRQHAPVVRRGERCAGVWRCLSAAAGCGWTRDGMPEVHGGSSSRGRGRGAAFFRSACPRGSARPCSGGGSSGGVHSARGRACTRTCALTHARAHTKLPSLKPRLALVRLSSSLSLVPIRSLSLCPAPLCVGLRHFTPHPPPSF